MTSNRFWWGFGVVLVGLATAICLMPLPHVPKTFEWNDKTSHLLGHGALALYFAGLVPRRSWWKIFAALLAFGIVIELAQHAMALGRHGDVRDVVANSSGAVFGLVLGWLGLARWPELADWVFRRRARS